MENTNQNGQLKSDPSSKVIFVVDDEETIVEFLKYYLEVQGFKVETSYDGLSAYDKIKVIKPDLIIMDAMLPKKSGYELVKSLQQNFELKRIPLIVITGKFRDLETQRMFSYETNVKDYLLKPIQPDYLITKIHKILNTKPKEEGIVEQKVQEYKKSYEQE